MRGLFKVVKSFVKKQTIVCSLLVIFGVLVLAFVFSQKMSDDSSSIIATTSTQMSATTLATKIVEDQRLPEGLKWQTNLEDPVYASSKAKPGGTLNLAIASFPLTLRTIGPDSNTSFRSYILDNHWSLVDIHPNTRNIIPSLAVEWAFGEDQRSMFFKIHPKAQWSDGVSVTTDDFLFAVKLMQSPHILAPFYSDYFKQHIEKVVKYDEKTLGVFATKPYPNLEQYVSLTPRPKHFYKDEIPENFIKKYNWEIEPVTGPYLLTKVRKGKSFTFEKQKNWWASDLKYIKNRFNPERLLVKVVRDDAVNFELFKKGNFDTFEAMTSERWHLKCQGDEFSKGYIEKTTFYTDSPRSNRGFYLNTSDSMFKERQIRYAFAHAMHIDLAIKQIFRGDVYRLDKIFTGYGDYENKTIKARNYEIERVESIMKSLGWERDRNGIWAKNSQRFSVRVTYSHEIYTKYLSFLKEEAKKAGVEMILEFMDSSSAFKKVMERKHQSTFWAWSTSLIPSPWQTFHSDNAKPNTNNISNTSDQQLDEWIDTYRQTTDKAKHQDLAKQIAQRVHDLGDFVPSHYFPFVRACHWRWMRLPEGGAATLLSAQAVFDATSSTTGGLFWIDQDMKKATLDAKKKGEAFPSVIRIENQPKNP